MEGDGSIIGAIYFLVIVTTTWGVVDQVFQNRRYRRRKTDGSK